MKNILPVMLLKNLLLLPNQEVKIELNNDLSKNVALLSIENYRSELVILTPRDQIEEVPDLEDLPEIAVIAKIKSKIELPNGNYRVTLRGLFRASTKNFKNNKLDENILECTYNKLEIPSYDAVEALAIRKKLITMLNKYVKNAQGTSNSILNLVKEIKDINKLTDLIASFLPIDFLKKLEYIEEINPVVRGTKLLEDLQFELEVIKLDQKIEHNLYRSIEENQKEFILKEKLREIREELGENDTKQEEVNNYHEKLQNLKINNSKTLLKIESEIKKLEYTNESNPEISNIRNYLDWITELPWGIYSDDEGNLNTIRKRLDKTHYGMEKAKAKILEYIAAKNRNPLVDSPIICLVGPAGVGKTTFAKSIAESLNKEFYKISVGGLNDSAMLNGHRRTYLGANPGKIIESLKRTKTSNPLILIDEVDKMVKDYKGDPASVLLDILDKAQNKEFIDNYIEEPFDLSNVLFILTANRIYDIPYELYDRLEVVELSSYTLLEKLDIAKKYLLPIIYEEHNINVKDIKFSDVILKEIILGYTNEAGVRDLKRVLVTIFRKLIVKDEISKIKIDSTILSELLGPKKYDDKITFDKEIPGVVNGMAVTSMGGIVTPIEAVFYEGKGNVKLTGMLEKVMSESVSVALSHIKTNKDIYQINDYYFKTKDLHIHALDASTRKDGPSAGIALTTSVISLAINKVVPKTIAMTGEITLNGFIKKIGGLKEKLIGSYNAGIKKVFIPKENHNDLIEIPDEVLQKLEIIEVSHYKEVYDYLFISK